MAQALSSSPAATPPPVPPEQEAVAELENWRDRIFRAATAWSSSFLVHAILLIVLGLLTVAVKNEHHGIFLSTTTSDKLPPIDTMEIGQPDIDSGQLELGALPESAGLYQPDAEALDVVVGSEAWLPTTGEAESLMGEIGKAVGSGREVVSSGGNGQPGKGLPGGAGVARFYGTEARGLRFVYIVDCSSSMTGPRFEKACAQLLKSIKALESNQSFYVIFFNATDYCQFYPSVEKEMTLADPQNIKRIERWVGEVVPNGFTDPSSAIYKALQLEPDAVFLLSDGEFELDRVMQAMASVPNRTAPIHTIALESAAGEPMLFEIARQTGGNYRFVP